MLQSQKGNRSQTRLIDSSTSARLSGFVALLPASHVTAARNAPTSAIPAAASRMNKPGYADRQPQEPGVRHGASLESCVRGVKPGCATCVGPSAFVLHDCLERGCRSRCPVRFRAGWQPRPGWLRPQCATGLLRVRRPGLAIQERAARPCRSRTTGAQGAVLDCAGDAGCGLVRRRPGRPRPYRRLASRRVGVRDWPCHHFPAPLALARRDEATGGFTPCEPCASRRWSPFACGCRSGCGHARIHPPKHHARLVVGRPARRVGNRARTRNGGVALGYTAPLRLGTVAV